jgi:copper chaperone CopZ
MMKTKTLGLVVLFFLGTFTLSAKEKSEKFLVNGKCEMCEKRIEMAAVAVEGVDKADWNKETKFIQVCFNDSKTDIHKINMAIAKAGHDTKMHKADDKAYESLPDCCKYDRSKLEAPKEKQKYEHK